MISVSSRGPILAIMIYFLLRILFYKPKTNRLYLKIIVIIILIISIILLICFMEQILNFINDILEKISIDSIPLQRIITKLERGGDLTSGRIDIYKQAIDDISHSFILGNGIAAFEDQHGGYVHNVFLQIIYEGGLICIGYFIYLMFSLVKNLITQPKEEVKFLIFMISISLVQLMMSLFYWYSPKFWLLIGYLIYLKRKTREVKNKNEIL